ncbi:MAG: IS200/IS605 family transposase [Cyclobacteriaceae bacterium]
MANTYTQLYFHVVFAVKGRANLISPKWKEDLYKYITGIIKNKNQKLIAINGMPNHIHLLIGMKPDGNLSDLVRDIKANSSRFVNEMKLVSGKFEWQNGFGAFTLGHSQLDSIADYIRKQEEHHQTTTFKEEYQKSLRLSGIDFDAQHIFQED